MPCQAPSSCRKPALEETPAPPGQDAVQNTKPQAWLGSGEPSNPGESSLWDDNGGNLRATSTNCTSFTSSGSSSPVPGSVAPSRLCTPRSRIRTFSTWLTTEEISKAPPANRICPPCAVLRSRTDCQVEASFGLENDARLADAWRSMAIFTLGPAKLSLPRWPVSREPQRLSSSLLQCVWRRLCWKQALKLRAESASGKATTAEAPVLQVRPGVMLKPPNRRLMALAVSLSFC
mmetsp:Transcript_27322/g.77106  ORF Transcript_27322/g.77106 Transcript_27322/m.77106 type:complete len:233 (-) Transcript_27322:1921-2619(-)